MTFRIAVPFLLFTACAAFADPPAPGIQELPAPIRDQDYHLVFDEEFDGPAGAKPDPTKWSPRTLGHWREAWNVEDCARLDGNGKLVISLRKNGDRVETGYIGTQGKFAATHGYFECRCQLQKAVGCWSAFWIQTPKMGDPEVDPSAGVEIDVMEYIEGGPYYHEKVRHTGHWGGYDKEHHKSEGVGIKVPGVSEGFHTFATKWDEAGYVFYVDGVETGRWKNVPMSNRPEFLILSCEVQGWAGDIGKATLPDAFTVDYVRVWQTPAQIAADKARAEAEEAEKIRADAQKTAGKKSHPTS